MDCIITELHGIKRKTKNKYNIGILIKMQNVQVTRLEKNETSVKRETEKMLWNMIKQLS